jgi:hypothetical protein
VKRAAGVRAFTAAGLVAGTVFLSGQTAVPRPRRGSGDSVTGAFEGWFTKPDGSRAFLVGYYNRNSQQELDVPIGPDNRIEPGGPDMGQPTHFLTGRQWGIFVVPVPGDFKPTDSYTWTIVSNGQTTAIPLRLNPDYVMSPFSEVAVGNTPPSIRFDPDGKTTQGPLATLASAASRSVAMSQSLPLEVWATDDMKYTSGTSAPLSKPRPAVTLRWSKYRGPGIVTFEHARPSVEKVPGEEAPFVGHAQTTATFSQPGDYVLHVIANDFSGDGGGGFGCCWTTAFLRVTVKE